MAFELVMLIVAASNTVATVVPLTRGSPRPNLRLTKYVTLAVVEDGSVVAVQLTVVGSYYNVAGSYYNYGRLWQAEVLVNANRYR